MSVAHDALSNSHCTHSAPCVTRTRHGSTSYVPSLSASSASTSTRSRPQPVAVSVSPAPNAKPARGGPQVLLVLAARILNGGHPAGDRLRKRVEVTEYQEASVGGLEVERASVAHARRPHAPHLRVRGRVHGAPHHAARGEIEPGMEM